MTTALHPLPIVKVPDLMREYAAASEWWKRAAALAHALGRSRIISGRLDPNAYLLRFWLTPPKAGDDQGLDSGDSVLLHVFARGDDDQALHDHPWDFKTTILAGGYYEHLPTPEWLASDRIAGPKWDARRELRTKDQSIYHDATDLHCVGEILPGTVTLVQTRPRSRSWGFHPEGDNWVPWKTYLNIA